MAEAEPAQPADLTWPVLFAYGAPSMPLASLQLPLYLLLPAYYAQDLGLGLTAVGLALLSARIFDMITDPVIGALSDRTATRLGRRKPWMVIGAPLLAFSVWMLFRPPGDITTTYLLVWSMAVYLASTLVILPYQAWGAELSSDYDVRSRITGTREALTVVGTLAAAALPALMAGGAGAALGMLAVMLVITLPVLTLSAAFIVPDAPARERVRVGWRKGLAVMLANGPFARLLVAYLMNGIANGLPATLFVFFVTIGLGLDMTRWGGPLIFIYFLCGVVSVPFWLALARRHGKDNAWLIAMASACVFFATVPFIPAGAGYAFGAVCVLTGLCLGADLALPASMQADVIDYDRAQGGGERAGLYFAIWGMATKLALAIAVGMAFPLLEIAGLDATTGTAEGAARWTLVGLYALAPIAFKLAAMMLMWRFPITRQRQEELRRLIESGSMRQAPANNA